MNRNDLDKKKVIDAITANDFAKLNGAIVRTMGVIFHSRWEKASNLKLAFKDKEEIEIYQSLDYLQLCGAVTARTLDSRDEVEINMFDLDEIEIRLTADGIKLWMLRKKDELIEI